MITKAQTYISELIHSPRRTELLKPAVMFTVNFILWIVVVEIIKNALVAADPSKFVALSWASVINAFSFGMLMPPFMHLLEAASNIRYGSNHNMLKLANTVMTTIMFACTAVVAVFFPDTSAVGAASIPALMIAALVSMATFIVMTIVERRITEAKVL